MNKKNKNVIKTFSLADLDIIRREGGDDDVDFAYVELGFYQRVLMDNIVGLKKIHCVETHIQF